MGLRLPSPGDEGAQPVGDYANESGFCSVIMADLQRIFACLMVDSPNKDTTYLCAVANMRRVTFSSKITLTMSSHASWRTLGSGSGRAGVGRAFGLGLGKGLQANGPLQLQF